MPTPYEDLYTAIQAMMANVATASPETVTLAPDNYDTEFRITAENSFYQVHISPAADFHRATVKHPRAEVSIFIHHHRTLAADEIVFLHQTMSHAADEFLDGAKWRAQTGIYDLDFDSEPEISEASRDGRVTSFEITATVLMNSV